MHRRIVVVVVAALVAGMSGQLSGQTQAPEAPTLAGKWQIDPTRSDRPGAWHGGVARAWRVRLRRHVGRWG